MLGTILGLLIIDVTAREIKKMATKNMKNEKKIETLKKENRKLKEKLKKTEEL